MIATPTSKRKAKIGEDPEKELRTRVEAQIDRSIGKLPANCRPTVRKFLLELEARGLKIRSRQNYVLAIRKLCKYVEKPFEELTKEDVQNCILGLRRELKESTFNTYAALIKKFLQWIHYGGDADTYPKCVRWIKTRCERKNLEQEVMSKEEVRKTLNAAESQRDRTLIFVGYESGFRRTELTNLKVKDVKFDKYGAVVRVRKGKTGGRRVRLVNSVPDLRLWLSIYHPNGEDPEAPLWPSRNRTGNGISGDRLFRIVRKYTEKALGKKLSPHALRHSRATHLAPVITEPGMRKFFGWEENSMMPAIYVHLSGRDVDEELLESYGIDIEPEEEKESNESPLAKAECPSCGFENPGGSRFCARCSLPLDDKTAFEIQEARERASDIEGKLMKWFTENATEILMRGIRETGIESELEGFEVGVYE